MNQDLHDLRKLAPAQSSVSPSGPYRQWLEYYRPVPHARLRLFCFHHAGGSALLFRDWWAELPAAVELCPVEMPGRGRRYSEGSLTDLIEQGNCVAREISRMPEVPIALFGYSMGAILAFEAAKALEASGRPVELLIVAAAAPRTPLGFTDTWKLPRAELIERLRQLNGTPEEVLQNDELMDLFLGILRSDFRAVGRYRFDPAVRVSCPLVAFAGSDDGEASPDQLQTWAECAAGPLIMRTIPGDHGFVVRPAPGLFKELRTALEMFVPAVSK